MTKRLLASLLAVLMVVSMIPLTAFAAGLSELPTLTNAGKGTWNIADKTYTIELVDDSDSDAVTALGDGPLAVYEEKKDVLSKVEGFTATKTDKSGDTPGTLALGFTALPTEAVTTYYIGTPKNDGGSETAPETSVRIENIPIPVTEVNITIATDCEAGEGKSFPEAEVTTEPMVPPAEDGGKETPAVTVETAWTKGEEEATGPSEAGTYTATFTPEDVEGYKLADDAVIKVNDEEVGDEITATVTAKAALTKENFTLKINNADAEQEYAYSDDSIVVTVEPVDSVTTDDFDYKVCTKATDNDGNITYTEAEPKNVGEYVVLVTAKGDDYKTESETGLELAIFTITPLELTVKAELQGDEKITREFSADDTSLPNGWESKLTITFVDEDDTTVDKVTSDDYTVTGEYADAAIGDAKDVKVTVALKETVKNYTLKDEGVATATGAGTITKKTITVGETWSDVTNLVYNGEDHTPTLKVDEDVVSALKITYETTAKDGSDKIEGAVKNAGTYTTKATVELESTFADNYTLAGLTEGSTSLEREIEWTIGKAPLAGTVTIDAGSGEVQDGTKLTASVEWSKGPVKSEEPVLTYQWKKGETNIDDATTNEYTIENGADGDVFKVAVGLSEAEVNANYELTLTNEASVKFGATSLTGATVTLSADSFDYNTQVQKPTVEKVEVGESESLTEVAAENYEVTYSDAESTNAGNYNVIITGKGDYTGSVTKPYSIKQVDATADKTTVSVAAEASDTVTVTTDGEVSAASTATETATVSVEGTTVTITGVAAGETTVTITTGAGTNYKATSITVNVTVTAADDTETPTVTISGAAKVGGVLTAKVTGASAEATKTYKWYRDDELIADATAETYTLVEADEGKTIKVGVTIGDAAEIKSDGVGPVASASASDPSVSQTEVSVKASSTTTVTVTGGEITNVESADESIATATFSGQTVTISGVAAGGPVDITITTAASDDYTAGSLTVAVTVTAAGGSTNPGYNPGTGSGTTTPNPTPSTSPDPTTPPAPTPEPPKATVEPTVEGDTASGTVSGDTITDLIEEAGNDGAGEVVVEVKPSGTDAVDVVKTELPAGSMKDLADAKVDLTVSTPVADVTLPQETLKELGAGEGPVTVTAAQTDTGTAGAPATTITVTVEQGGAAVEAGVTATVPADVVSNMAGNSNGTVTVSTPVADVVLPNSTLTAAGKNDVSVSAVPTANGTSIEVKRNGVTMTNASVQVAVPVPETSDDSTVAYIVDANGNKTILPKSVAADGEMKVLLDTGKATITYQNNAKTFTDSASVPGWAKSSFTTSRELIKGIDNGNGGMAFRPNKTTTRAELVTMLHRLESEPTVGNVNFDDMKGNEWYKDAAAWAQTKGVVNGTDKGFEGNKTITRQELATMLYRYMQNVTGYKGKTGDYSGIAGGDKVNSWAAEAMRWAYGSGIITGKSDSAGNTNLDPAGLATRAEVSAMLERFVKLIAA